MNLARGRQSLIKARQEPDDAWYPFGFTLQHHRVGVVRMLVTRDRPRDPQFLTRVSLSKAPACRLTKVAEPFLIRRFQQPLMPASDLDHFLEQNEDARLIGEGEWRGGGSATGRGRSYRIGARR